MTQQPPPQSPQPPEGTPEQTAPDQTTPQPAATEPAGPEHTTALGYDQTQAYPLGYDQPQAQPLGYDQPQAQPLWYRETQAQPQYPAYPPVSPPATTEPPRSTLTQNGAEPAQPTKPRRLAELVTVAAIAAVLTSAGTVALTRGDIRDPSPAAQTQSSATSSAAPVVQANAVAPNWAVTAAAVSPSVVAITVQSGQGGGQGSGVIFDTEGRILTNNHVVAAAGQGSTISVTLNDLRTYDATVVGTDSSTDLAVIKLDKAPKDLKAIALGDAKALTVGEPVMAVGNPLGLAGTVTTGIVSALNRPVTTSPQPGNDPSGQSAADAVVTNAIQTSAAINPGNSGGALVNAGGQLIGINSSIASLGSSGGSSQSGNIGIGFAIPVNEAKSIADQLITSGKAAHAYLGVSSKDDIVAQGSAKRAAAVITKVANGTPADKAGLQAGDAIVALDGDSIDGSLSLVAQVRERTVNDKVTIKIVRDGQNKDINVTLTNRPTTNP